MKLLKTFFIVLLFALFCSIHTRFGSRFRVADAKSYVQFARISYCNAVKLLEPTCEVCQQLGSLGYAVEKAHTYDRIVNGRQITFTMTISKSLNGMQLIVSFGGPKTEEIIHIQNLYSSGFININNNKIEKGFWDIYQGAMKHDLINRLDDGNFSELVFVGHSVGGSMAVLASYDVSVSNLRIPKPHVFVYGALTIGDQNFMNHFKNLADVVRIKKNEDLYMQFPTCLITGTNVSTCFEDYTSLFMRYPVYRPYLNVAYPFLHGYGSWPSPFYAGYGYGGNGYGGYGYGGYGYGGYGYGGYGSQYGLHGGLYDYPSRSYLRDDPQDRDRDHPDKLAAINDKEPGEEPIPSLNNKKDDAPSKSASVEDLLKIQKNMKNLKNTKEEVSNFSNGDSEVIKNRIGDIESENDENVDNEDKNEDIEGEKEDFNNGNKKRNTSNTRSNEYSNGESHTGNHSQSYENYKTESINDRSAYSPSSNNRSYSSGESSYGSSFNSGSSYNSGSSAGFVNSGSSYNRGANRRNFGGSSSNTGSANFLETKMRRSTSKNRKVYRKAFLGYFSAFDNCKVNGKAANCQLNPSVHKTYYGVDIENCY